MKKSHLLLFFVPLILFIVQCKKEEVADSTSPIEIEYEIHNVSVFGGSDGSVDLTVTGGIPPYSFYWSNNEKKEDLYKVAAGKYTVIISDSKYNIRTDSFKITQPEPEAIILAFDVHYPTTNNGSDGSIKVTVSGGYPPYTIYWSTGSSSETISGLSPGIYIVTITDSRAQILTDTVPLNNFIIDTEGNCYTTVEIGDQTWMQQNMRVTKTAGGKAIENYIYNNDTTYLKKYGRLYPWNAAMNGSKTEGAQGICPDGWHVPSDGEYKKLEKALGMNEELNLLNTWRGTNIGTKLKSGGSSGFNALLSGRRLDDGTFSYIDRVEYLWTSTESGNESAWRRNLDNTRNEVGRFDSSLKTYGFSVRCIKND